MKNLNQGNHNFENADKLMEMIKDIKPVSTKYSSEEMIRLVREGKMELLLDDKTI